MVLDKFGFSKLRLAIVSTALLFAMGCNNGGVQSGNLISEFGGLSRVEAVSPNAVRLSWALQPRFTKYKVYKEGNNNSIKEEIFSQTMITGLTASTEYRFSVTGVDKDGKEEGLGNFQPITTLSPFPGVTAQSLTLKSASRVDITWTVESSLVTYALYARKESESWDFATPAQRVVGLNSGSVSNLTDGTAYCFYVVAEYLDSTSEPSVTDLNAVNSNAPCMTTLSDLQGVPTVAANSIIPGNFPWFTASGGLPDMQIDIFEKESGTRIASRTGDGVFRAFASVVAGKRIFYAQVSKIEGNVVKKAIVNVKNPENQTAIHVRAIQSSGLQGPIYPRLISDGKGVQRLGNQVRKGDFNCDGLPDIASSAYLATPSISNSHVSQMGAVVIHYTRSIAPFTAENPSSQVVYKLKTDVAPTTTAIAPNPQLIYYPVTASNYRFGKAMAVGNFNGDCSRSGTSPMTGLCDTVYGNTVDPAPPDLSADISKIYSCDDLAVLTELIASASGYFGDVYVIYGSPNGGLVSGSGSTNYGINEATCDPVTGSCRAVKMNHNSAVVTAFGRSLTTGDYNNDGFDDLAIGSKTLDGAGGYLYPRVTVLRGSSQGTLPITSTYSFPDILAGGANVYNATVDIGSETFGESLGTAYNSRLCNVRNGSFYYRSTAPAASQGYDLTKCDDLVIGDPGRNNDRGSIVVCKGAGYSTANADENIKTKIGSWTCLESWPDALEDGALYGSSIQGVWNQNGYPIASPGLDTGLMPDVTGAVFVGAPNANYPYDQTSTVSDSGLVFGYYVTPKTAAIATGLQTVLGAGAHTITAINSIACDRENDNLANHCDHQVIYPSAPQSNSGFGEEIGILDDIDIFDRTRNLPFLAIAAPRHDYTASGGLIKTDAGVVYVYKPDLSILGFDAAVQVTAPKRKAGGTGSGFDFFSGGLSPFGPSLIYNPALPAYSLFGSGGIAGDNFDGVGRADLVTSAPLSNLPYVDSGGVYIYNSSGGIFSATQTVPSLAIEDSVSKEVDYRFDMAKVIGDVNADGYDDVITNIQIGSFKNEVALYYGSATGLIQTAAPSLAPSGLNPKLLRVTNVNSFGKLFFKIGSVNGDAFDDILFVTSSGSIIYYGSSTGLVTASEPTVSPVGKNPLLFARSIDGGIEDLELESVSNDLLDTVSYDYGNQAVAYGDFNGDGFGDFAVGLPETYALPTDVDVTGAGDFSAASRGRIIVIYGSLAGPQLGNTTGRIRRFLPADPATVAEVTVKNPCSLDGSFNPPRSICKVQMLAGSSPNSFFGQAVVAVPSLESSLKSDGIVVGDPFANASAGAAYHFRGSTNGLETAPRQTFVPHENDHKFGASIASLGDVNGDTLPDLAISAPLSNGTGTDNPSVYVFYGTTAGGVAKFAGATTLTGTDYWTTPPVLNALHSSSSDLKPQVIRPAAVTLVEAFGEGIAGGIDFNKDGYNDLLVNVPLGNYNLDVSITAAGYVLVYFGGPLGLRSLESISPNPKCYGDALSYCDPYQIFLPERTAREYTYLSSQPVGDINGDGVTDLIFGGVGRPHPSGKAFSTGVVYVVY